MKQLFLDLNILQEGETDDILEDYDLNEVFKDYVCHTIDKDSKKVFIKTIDADEIPKYHIVDIGNGELHYSLISHNDLEKLSDLLSIK